MKKTKIRAILLGMFYIFTNFLFIINARAQETETVKIYHLPTIAKAPLYIAMEESFFKEQGINIEDISLKNSAEALIALNQGAIDILMSPPTAGMINLMGEGKNIKIAAGLASISENGLGIAIRETKELHKDNKSSLEKLKGKKIGIPIFGDLANYFVEKKLKKNGVSIKEVDFVIMPIPTAMEMLSNDILDASYLTEPYITMIKSKAKISFSSFFEEFPNAHITFLVYGPNLLTKKPGLGIRFLKAYIKGCKQYSQGKTARNMEILNKYLKFDKEILKKSDWPVVNPEISDIGVLKDYQDWLFEKKHINKKIIVESMFDKSFLEKAK